MLISAFIALLRYLTLTAILSIPQKISFRSRKRIILKYTDTFIQ